MVHVCNIPYSLSCSIFPVKISVFPLFIQSYWPVQTKIRQYVHWSNIVAVRLLTRATAKLNQCVVFVFRLILVVTLYNGFTRYSIWIDNHCLAASLQPVSTSPIVWSREWKGCDWLIWQLYSIGKPLTNLAVNTRENNKVLPYWLAIFRHHHFNNVRGFHIYHAQFVTNSRFFSP